MKTTRILVALMLSAFAAAVTAQQNANPSPDVLLKAAMQHELIDGDLNAAIEEYRQISTKYADNHAVAARALLQMAGCYERLGRPGAQQIYGRIIKDYSDSGAAFTAARIRLEAMQVAAGPFKPRDLVQPLTGTPSPDGKFIAYTRPRPSRPGEAPAMALSPDVPGDVLCIRALTSTTERVLFDPGRNALIGSPRWSHDSQRVAFSVGEIQRDVMHSRMELRVATIATGDARALASAEALGLLTGPHWSPDDQWLAFSLQSIDQGPRTKDDLRVVSIATGESRSIASSSSPGTPQGTTEYVWSPDSRRVAYHPSGTDDIRVVTLATGDTRSLAIPAPRAGGQTALDVIDTHGVGWTPKDDIVFRQKYPSIGNDFFLIAATGGEARRICEGRGAAGGDTCDALSPDGSVFISRQKASGRLVVRDVASGTNHFLTHGSGEEQTVGPMSPDGRLILFKSNQDSRWALYVAPLSPSPIENPVRIAYLDGPSSADSASWTKDGQLIARSTYSDVSVYRLDIDPKTGRVARGAERLTQDAPRNELAAVSPDGLRIAYWFSRPGKSGIALMDASGADERPIFDHPLFRQGGFSPRLFWRSADQLLFPESAGTATDKLALSMLNLRTGALDRLPELDTWGTAGWNWTYSSARSEVLYAHTPDRIMPGPMPVVLRARSLVDNSDREVATITDLSGFAVSPDGRHIAYSRFIHEATANVSARDGVPPAPMIGKPTPVEMRLMTMDGAEEKLLLQIPNPVGVGGYAFRPLSWSADGEYLLFANAGPGFSIMKVATSEYWPLDVDGIRSAADGKTTWSDPQWSANGSFIVLTGSGTRTDSRSWEGVTFDTVTRLLRR